MSEKSELLKDIRISINCLNITTIKLKKLKYKDNNKYVYNDNERFLFLQGYVKAINDLAIELLQQVIVEQLSTVRYKK